MAPPAEETRGTHFLDQLPEVHPSSSEVDFCFVEKEEEDAFSTDNNRSRSGGEVERVSGRREHVPEQLLPVTTVDITVPANGGRSTAGGLQRLWEGGLFEIGDHSDVTIQTACCPCATFGTNMERSGFGTSWGQGGILLLLSIGAVSFYVMFLCTGSPWFIYGMLSLLVLMAMYAGHYRARIRKRFNIIGSEGGDTVSSIDDHLYHIMCGCCSLCQEARTLKTNNVLNGQWYGRGDILVIGSQVLFTPAGTTQLSPAAYQRFSPWQKHPASKTDQPLAAVTTPSTSDPEIGHSWSCHALHQQQSLPLLKY
jgi:Cys-rich protein (TIGR01571 family)